MMGSVFVRAFDGTECITGLVLNMNKLRYKKKLLNVFVATRRASTGWYQIRNKRNMNSEFQYWQFKCWKWWENSSKRTKKCRKCQLKRDVLDTLLNDLKSWQASQIWEKKDSQVCCNKGKRMWSSYRLPVFFCFRRVLPFCLLPLNWIFLQLLVGSTSWWWSLLCQSVPSLLNFSLIY